MQHGIERWEDDGGSVIRLWSESSLYLVGTESQVEWATRIRCSVNAEFDRVSKALELATRKQSPQNRADAKDVMVLLEEKRADVMGRREAGYFIHDWQELNGKVRSMICEDPRYKAIMAKRAANRSFSSPPDVR
jgi:hypothetical protein